MLAQDRTLVLARGWTNGLPCLHSALTQALDYRSYNVKVADSRSVGVPK